MAFEHVSAVVVIQDCADEEHSNTNFVCMCMRSSTIYRLHRLNGLAVNAFNIRSTLRSSSVVYAVIALSTQRAAGRRKERQKDGRTDRERVEKKKSVAIIVCVCVVYVVNVPLYMNVRSVFKHTVESIVKNFKHCCLSQYNIEIKNLLEIPYFAFRI